MNYFKGETIILEYFDHHQISILRYSSLFEYFEKATFGMREYICKPYIFAKGLIPRIYNKLLQLNSQIKKERNNNLIFKWAKGLNGHISKENMQIANRFIERCSNHQPPET